MENKENLVTEQVTENTEQTAEETPAAKTYTQEEVDAIVGKKIARTKAKIEKKYSDKYDELETVLKAGMGKEDVGEITSDLRQFYTEKKGIKIPERSRYSEQDNETLARADAAEIIRGGYDEVVEELDRLTELGVANMSAREKATFKILAEHQQNEARGRELSKLGVTEDVYNSEEFKSFQSKFSANTPISEVYDIYAKTQPKKEIRTMGSMKNGNSADSGVKEFYTPEEARTFTKADFDKNPALYKAVVDSMTKWKR